MRYKYTENLFHEDRMDKYCAIFFVYRKYALTELFRCPYVLQRIFGQVFEMFWVNNKIKVYRRTLFVSGYSVQSDNTLGSARSRILCQLLCRSSWAQPCLPYKACLHHFGYPVRAIVVILGPQWISRTIRLLADRWAGRYSTPEP